jgi:V8-like Glu-specific endopeptidase
MSAQRPASRDGWLSLAKGSLLDRPLQPVRAMRRSRLLVLGGVSLVLVGSCQYDPDIYDLVDGDEELGGDSLEIRHGRSRDDHPEIGQLFLKIDGKWGGYCTATLVDRRIAITAGHCMDYKNQDRVGNYGYLEIRTPNASGGIKTTRHQISGYHNFDGKPQDTGGDPDDIGLVRLAKPVPCNVARPARLSKNGPATGTVVSRWGYGVCHSEAGRKRVRHFRRGDDTFFVCPGDSGGPTLDPDGAVYQINSGGGNKPGGGVYQDKVARVAKEWNGITRVMDGWKRAGRCP